MKKSENSKDFERFFGYSEDFAYFCTIKNKSTI